MPPKKTSFKPNRIISDEESDSNNQDVKRKHKQKFYQIKKQQPVSVSHQKDLDEHFTPSKTIDSKKIFLRFLISEANDAQLQQSLYDIETEQFEAVRELIEEAVSQNSNFAEEFEKRGEKSKGIKHNQKIIEQILFDEKVSRAVLRNNSSLLRHLLQEGMKYYRKKQKSGEIKSSEQSERTQKKQHQTTSVTRKRKLSHNSDNEEEEERTADDDEVFSERSEESEGSYILEEYEELFTDGESGEESEEKEEEGESGSESENQKLEDVSRYHVKGDDGEEYELIEEIHEDFSSDDDVE